MMATPPKSNAAFSSGFGSIALISRLSFSMIARGVLAGAKTPPHALMVTLPRPASGAGGASGSNGLRVGNITASTRIRPSFASGVIAEEPNMSWMRPEAMSLITIMSPL